MSDKKKVIRFDHDNEGQQPLSPHAMMARAAVERSQREAQKAELDLAVHGFAVIDLDEGKRVDPTTIGFEDGEGT